jgi:hypothetical protein
MFSILGKLLLLYIYIFAQHRSLQTPLQETAIWCFPSIIHSLANAAFPVLNSFFSSHNSLYGPRLFWSAISVSTSYNNPQHNRRISLQHLRTGRRARVVSMTRMTESKTEPSP